MSRYTTLRVSRRAAFDKLAELRRQPKPTNVQLENELELFLMEKTGYNFWVVDEDEAADDRKLRGLFVDSD